MSKNKTLSAAKSAKHESMSGGRVYNQSVKACM